MVVRTTILDGLQTLYESSVSSNSTRSAIQSNRFFYLTNTRHDGRN
jgi:hypothetical protein